MTALEQKIQSYLDDKFEFNTNVTECEVIARKLDEQKNGIRVLITAHRPGVLIGRGGEDIMRIAKKIETEFQTYPMFDVQSVTLMRKNLQ
jgi:ribosomal protein S3